MNQYENYSTFVKENLELRIYPHKPIAEIFVKQDNKYILIVELQKRLLMVHIEEIMDAVFDYTSLINTFKDDKPLSIDHEFKDYKNFLRILHMKDLPQGVKFCLLASHRQFPKDASEIFFEELIEHQLTPESVKNALEIHSAELYLYPTFPSTMGIGNYSYNTHYIDIDERERIDFDIFNIFQAYAYETSLIDVENKVLHNAPIKKSGYLHSFYTDYNSKEIRKLALNQKVRTASAQKLKTILDSYSILQLHKCLFFFDELFETLLNTDEYYDLDDSVVKEFMQHNGKNRLDLTIIKVIGLTEHKRLLTLCNMEKFSENIVKIMEQFSSNYSKFNEKSCAIAIVYILSQLPEKMVNEETFYNIAEGIISSQERVEAETIEASLQHYIAGEGDIDFSLCLILEQG